LCQRLVWPLIDHPNRHLGSMLNIPVQSWSYISPTIQVPHYNRPAILLCTCPALNTMAPLEPAEEDAIPMQLLQELSRTAYVCSSLSSPLSSRPGNLVYRGVLAQPIRTPDGATVQSIIIKHSTAACETSFNSDFLANTKTRVGRAIAIPPPFGHDTKY